MSWTLIESQTLGASAASVTLGSGGTIPQTYKSLKVVVSMRGDSEMGLQINGSSANFTGRGVYGNGASAFSWSSGNWVGNGDPTGYTANTFGSVTIELPNYASSTTYKAIASDSCNENNGTTAYTALTATLWSSNSAVTSLTLTAYSGGGAVFVSGSTFYLYGLK